MAQDFRRYTANSVSTSFSTVFTANSYDTIIGIHVANTTSNMVEATVVLNDGSNDITLVNGAPIAAGGALQVLDGGAKFVVESGGHSEGEERYSFFAGCVGKHGRRN